MRKTCFETIHKIAKKDKKIIFIGSDLTPGIMGEFKKDLKERFIMEGVSEQHIVEKLSRNFCEITMYELTKGIFR